MSFFFKWKSHFSLEFGELFRALEINISRSPAYCQVICWTALPSWYLWTYEAFQTSRSHLPDCIKQGLLGGFSTNIFFPAHSHAASTSYQQTKLLPQLVPTEFRASLRPLHKGTAAPASQASRGSPDTGLGFLILFLLRMQSRGTWCWYVPMRAGRKCLNGQYLLLICCYGNERCCPWIFIYVLSPCCIKTLTQLITAEFYEQEWSHSDGADNHGYNRCWSSTLTVTWTRHCSV